MVSQPVDGIDRAILRTLATDGRMSIAELARQLRISRANAYARLERLTASGVIRGYGVRIDPRGIGLQIAALVFVTSEQGRWRELRVALSAVPEVEFIGLVAGEFDFVLLVRAATTDELRDVVLEQLVDLPGVDKTQTFFLLDELAGGPYIPDA
jgi:DNA-binding Lrp family transcriptional regulator